MKEVKPEKKERLVAFICTKQYELIKSGFALLKGICLGV